MSRDAIIYAANVALSYQQTDDGSPFRTALRVQSETEFLRLAGPLMTSIRGNVVGYALQVMHQRVHDGRMWKK